MEFLLLLLCIFFISRVMLAGINTGIADRWMKLVQLIASPDPQNPISLEFF